MPTYKPLLLGPLPTQAIDATLGTELEPGQVYLSARAHEHIAKDHPADYAVVMRHLPAVVARPTFVGQAPLHARNMELIGRVRVAGRRGHVLVAVGLEPDEGGRYRVRSAYVVEEAKVEVRRQKGYLRPLKG
jgi:CO/xanthine dehydrogenase FAD-binding subunit